MAQPKKKTSASKQGHRRAQTWKVEVPQLGTCPNCHAPVIPHTACASCGTYRGRRIIKVAAQG